jgi:tetratricopeptide (TPR) repeat protein
VAEAQQIAPRCLTAEQRQRFHLSAARPRWCDTMQKWPYDVVTIAKAATSAARGHIDANRHREAIAGLEQAIVRTPATAARLALTLAQAHDGIAWNAFLDVALRGKPVETLKDVLGDVEKAVKLAPDNTDYLDTRAHIRLTLGRTDEALADFEKAISLGLNYIGGWYGRGLAHERKANRDAAIADYRKAVALKPSDNDWAKHAHAQARAGLERLGAAP